jgi:hypothetical protein
MENNLERNNMSQQTALELVISQLKEHITKSAHNQLGTNRTGEYRIGLVKAIDFCEQAKAMEKDQHKQTWLDSTAQFDNAAAMTYKKDFEQYYNETYNK